jgi:hypothetical protein
MLNLVSACRWTWGKQENQSFQVVQQIFWRPLHHWDRKNVDLQKLQWRKKFQVTFSKFALLFGLFCSPIHPTPRPIIYPLIFLRFPATMPKLAKVGNSWDADWATSWDSSKPCTCKRQTYEGVIPAYDPLGECGLAGWPGGLVDWNVS